MTLYCNGQPYAYHMHDDWWVDEPTGTFELVADLTRIADAVWEGE